eukprot:scaffold2747_cov51-Attheya_sp.AAC.2
MTTPSVSESSFSSDDTVTDESGLETSAMSLEEAFSGSILSLVTADDNKRLSSSDIVEVSEHEGLLYQTRGYYRDSSGRSSLHLQLCLSCFSEEALETIRDSNCILPVPLTNKSTTNGDDDDKTDTPTTNHSGESNNASSHTSLEEGHPDKMASLRLEVESDPDQDDGSHTWCVLAVEGVTISKTSVEGCSIRFHVEVTVRAPSTAAAATAGTDDSTLSILRSQLQMRAILSRPQHHRSVPSAPVDPLAAGLLALELGESTVLMDSTPSRENGRLTKEYYGTSLTSLPAVRLNMELTQAVLVTVSEVGGARAAAGATLVSLTIQHPNTHDETLTITNIALHSGQSRLAPSTTTTATSNNASGASNSNVTIAAGTNEMTSTGASSFSSSISNVDGKRSMQGGQLSVIDMSRSVRWGYAPGTAPTLPLVLKPHEAFATVIVVDAGDNLESRAFASPVAVTALVGGSPTKQDDESKKKMVLTAADARWTTARVAVEPADAFRIDLSLRESQCKVGAPLVVQLKVLNLSHQTRDLMLLMAKDEDNNKTGGVNMLTTRNRKSPLKKKSNTTNNDTQKEEHCGVNTAVVSEVNGYTFGVWGLSGDDDGTIRHNRDHELLAVDAALLLGQVKGQQFIEAELRFVPLREGTLDVPNLRLYDKIAGNWYNCIHMLKIVVAAKDK